MGAPITAGRWLYRYAYEVIAALSLLANAVLLNLLRREAIRETLCAGCGRSMAAGGWASRIRWPRWFAEHCRDERGET